MPASDNFLRLAVALHKALKAAVRDSRFADSKLSSVADSIDVTVDALNNRLYGRVELTESFVVTAWRLLADSVPDLAAQVLQEWLIDPRLIIRHPDTFEAAITELDIRSIVLKAGREIGSLQGVVAEQMNDGRLDASEIDVQIDHVHGILKYFRRYEARLLRDKADALDANGRRKPSVLLAAAEIDSQLNGKTINSNGNGKINA